MPVRLRLVLAAVLLGGATACAPGEEPVALAPEPAPTVVLDTEAGPVHLADLVGRPVVVQLAPSHDEGAWAAFADALADLEASGAVVVAVETDGAAPEVAEAFGYDGTPLAVVVDGAGTVRGRTAPTSGDALFEMAGPVLAEADLTGTVSWPGADSLDALVDAGGLVVALAPTTDLPDGTPALHLDMATLAAEDLPADLGTPLAFIGTEANVAAEQAVGWGYAAVFVADAGGGLAPVEAPLPPAPEAPRSRGVRG